jgi:hypothetical protein
MTVGGGASICCLLTCLCLHTVAVQVNMPPPLDTMMIQTDANIIKGPQKCYPPECNLENGDLPSGKKVKPTKACGGSRPTKAKAVTKQITVEEPHKDTPYSCPHPHPRPIQTNQNLEGTGSSDDVVSNKSDEDKPEEEDDVTELRMCSIHLFMSCKHIIMAIVHMSKKWDAPVYVFFKPSATSNMSEATRHASLNVPQLVAAANPNSYRASSTLVTLV